MTRSICTSMLLLCTLLPTTVRGEKTNSLIGNATDDFTLRSHLGREWSLSDFSEDKLVVIMFLGTECPLVKLYAPRLAELHKKYADDGVAFVGVNSNTQDSMTELSAYAERYQVPFPLLKDVRNRVADALEAQRTPEVFVLDGDRKVRYHGRIDDQYGVGYARDKVNRRDLAMAIEELLAGKEVSVPSTEAVGCHIGRVNEVEPSGDVTYSNQISRIMNSRCVQCHRDGELAPFTLTSYDDVVGWEDTIVEVISDNRMPPWFANPEHGHFKNDARLSDEEKGQIYSWVENGMPEGDPANLPATPEFTEGWRIPKPDQVFYMRDEPFGVPAEGVVDYKHFVLDPEWDEDKYIYAAEARPDNNSVVHHILVYILPPDGQRRADLRSILVGYAPGSSPVLLEEGTALHVPAGSKLMFQMHYTPNGYKQSDRSYAGVCFMNKQDVKQLIRGRLAINPRFKIPAHADNHVVRASYPVKRDEMLVSMTPHMHLRGKSFRYEAVYPDGETEVLLDVPKYDFNWQIKYTLAEPKLLPKGTEIRCTARFDNSEENLVNPNPNEPVRWGDQSWEEMMIGFMSVIPAEKKREKSTDLASDPSGAWEWKRRQGLSMKKETLTLKLEDDYLSGAVETRGRTIPIQDAVMNGDQITFQMELPELQGVTLEFSAKVAEDEMNGKILLNAAAFGRSQTLPWNAKRVKD